MVRHLYKTGLPCLGLGKLQPAQRQSRAEPGCARRRWLGSQCKGLELDLLQLRGLNCFADDDLSAETWTR